MAEKEFLGGIAFSNLAGSRFSNFLKLVFKHGIQPKYWFRFTLNGLISLVLSLLSIGDYFIWQLVKNKLRRVQPPLFVIGHWRSGTTHLHNLLCIDERAGYSTTFQTVFPNLLFGFHRPMFWLLRLMMPKTRPVDNVELNARNPQEEEFGLGNVMEMSYYNWWYFPKKWDYFLDNYLELQDLSNSNLHRWKKTYLNFIRRALTREGKFWYVSKNPPNTARIPLLLEMFPQARFVYIQRNPYEVFVSSQRFFKAILEPLQMQDITEEDFNAHILKAYCRLFDAFEAHKHLIPENRLVELTYEDFMQNELKHLQHIYLELEIKLPLDLISKWIESLKKTDHQNKTYKFDPKTIALVNAALGDRIEKMGYERLAVSG